MSEMFEYVQAQYYGSIAVQYAKLVHMYSDLIWAISFDWTSF